jgi:hypothetical protein
MWRYEDVKIGGKRGGQRDVKMWRYEDVKIGGKRGEQRVDIHFHISTSSHLPSAFKFVC